MSTPLSAKRFARPTSSSRCTVARSPCRRSAVCSTWRRAGYYTPGLRAGRRRRPSSGWFGRRSPPAKAYGARCVFLGRREAGETCSKHRLARLTRENRLRALHGYRTRRWPVGKPAFIPESAAATVHGDAAQ